jgi:hypothetical protein
MERCALVVVGKCQGSARYLAIVGAPSDYPAQMNPKVTAQVTVTARGDLCDRLP